MAKTIVEIEEKDHGRDEQTIARLSKQIVGKALSPTELLVHVENFIEQESEDVEALRCAIDARYLDFKEIADEAHYQLEIIEEQLMLHIGLELGRRVSRD